MLPRKLEAEARAEIAQERAELNLERVAEAERRIERAMVRSSRSAERAQRNAARALAGAERERAGAEREKASNFDAKAATEGLREQLYRDGLIDAQDADFKFFLNDDVMKVDGDRQSDGTREAYQTFLKSYGWVCEEDFVLKSKPGYLYLEMTQEGSKTRITMND
jgi:hypothetical protein